MSDEIFDEYLRLIAQGKDSKRAVEALRRKSGLVKKPPAEFRSWIKDNRKRVAGWKSKPFWMVDNPGMVRIGRR